MNARGLAILLLVASVSYGQEGHEDQFSGTAVNTTNPDKPIAAPIEITLSHSGCKLTVSPPLTGSGSCGLKTFDEKSGHI